MKSAIRSDPRSLHLPNTGDLRQPRLAKLSVLVRKPKVGRLAKSSIKGISLAALMQPKGY
jgi:hypothetical protein